MIYVQELTANKLKVRIYDSRPAMGAAAAADVTAAIISLLEKQDYVNVVFAAAPSQNEFLEALSATETIDWSRVNAFHMDEYIGLPTNALQSFGQFLRERIFDRVAFNTVFYINGNADDLQAECARYSALLKQYPPDVVCMGVGENGHIAFNDPHLADFDDPELVKIVDLDETSRMQQVHDGCFDTLAEVPLTAITLTIPALFSGRIIFCVVPGSYKAVAVSQVIHDKVNEKTPATILRIHEHATIYLDKESASKILPASNLNFH